MKSRFLTDAVPLLLGLAAGIGFAAWIGARPPAPLLAAVVKNAPTSASAITAATPPSATLPPAASSSDAVVHDPASEPAWEMLSRLAPPRGKPDRWIKLPVLRAKGPPPPEHSLNPEFAEFFGLGPEEQARIESALDATIAQQSDLDLAHTDLIPIRPTDGFLSEYEQAFAIGPYPEEGARLHDGLNRSLREVMGEDRMAVYNLWAQGSLLADWQGVGLSERTIHVKRQNAGTQWERIDVNYSAKAPGGDYQQFNSMGNTLTEAEQQTNFPLGRWLEKHPLGAASAKVP